MPAKAGIQKVNDSMKNIKFRFPPACRQAGLRGNDRKFLPALSTFEEKLNFFFFFFSSPLFFFFLFYFFNCSDVWPGGHFRKRGVSYFYSGMDDGSFIKFYCCLWYGKDSTTIRNRKLVLSMSSVFFNTFF